MLLITHDLQESNTEHTCPHMMQLRRPSRATVILMTMILHLPGASRENNELQSSSDMSTESGGNQKLEGKRVAASDGNVQNVEMICESAIDGTFKDESKGGLVS